MASYSYRPLYGTDDNGQVYERHAEARAITRVGYEENAHLPDVDRALKAPRGGDPVALRRGRGWETWLGRSIKSGAYGSAFRLTYDGEVKRRLDAARQAASFLLEQTPVPAGARIVVKVARGVYDQGQAVPQTTADLFAKESVRESSWHRHLAASGCARVPGAALGVCPQAHVPAFHWAGMVNDALTGKRFYVTVMGVAPGITVDEYVARRRMTAPLYLAIEHAVVSMWLAGVAHSDFHQGNQLYEPASGTLTIIDFGMSMRLSDALVAQLRAALAPAIAQGVRSLGELWRTPEKSKVGLGVQAYANRLMYTRERQRQRALAGRGRRVQVNTDLWYNPDGHALRQMFNQLSAKDREEVPVRRRLVWGVGPVAAAPAQLLAAAAAAKLPSSSGSRSTRSSGSSGTRVSGRGTSSGPSPMNINSSGSNARGGRTCSKRDAMRRLCAS